MQTFSKVKVGNELMKVRIEKHWLGGKYEFFVDYKVTKGCWKNHSAFDSYDKALRSKSELLQKHMTTTNYPQGQLL